MLEKGKRGLLEFLTYIVYRDILDCIGVHLLG